MILALVVATVITWTNPCTVPDSGQCGEGTVLRETGLARILLQWVRRWAAMESTSINVRGRECLSESFNVPDSGKTTTVYATAIDTAGNASCIKLRMLNAVVGVDEVGTSKVIARDLFDVAGRRVHATWTGKRWQGIASGAFFERLRLADGRTVSRAIRVTR